ncbi:MAG: transposase [Planctomycetaceae bacterium]
MQNTVRFIGLDVHKETIMIAVAEQQGEAQVHKKVPNDSPRILKELRKLQRGGCELKVCYEAGPLGFGLQRFLKSKGIPCDVEAPSLIPVRSGERIKTDRRDARKLAHFLRSGDLTPIWIPDEQTEAIRDLERAREDARLGATLSFRHTHLTKRYVF